MEDTTRNALDVFFSFAQLVGLLVGAGWVYLRFWREGQHEQRIQFDIECRFSDPQSGARIASFSIIASNKGNVEQRFVRISLRLLGLRESDPLQRRTDERLQFSQEILEAELVPAKFGYYFVRPGVEQRISFTTAIPEEIRFINSRAAFKYNNGDLHTAEKVFDVIAGERLV
jgi:hypothetical protein